MEAKNTFFVCVCVSCGLGPGVFELRARTHGPVKSFCCEILPLSHSHQHTCTKHCSDPYLDAAAMRHDWTPADTTDIGTQIK